MGIVKIMFRSEQIREEIGMEFKIGWVEVSEVEWHDAVEQLVSEDFEDADFDTREWVDWNDCMTHEQYLDYSS